MSLTLVIGYAPVTVGVGCDHHIEPVRGLMGEPPSLKKCNKYLIYKGYR
jgi:hypothetical protein